MNILPTLEREKIYDEVRRLKQADAGIDVRTVRRELAGRFPVLPSRMTLQRWLNGETSPTTSMNKFDSTPSDALSFFLGAWIGDGWADENDGGKRMRLKVRSKSFATEFAHSATKVLSKSSPYRVWTTEDEGGKWYNVKATSLTLYRFVNQPFEDFRATIIQNPKGFLRGFFTAEGNPSVSLSRRFGLNVAVDLSNSDYPLLQEAQSMLCLLGFRPARIRLTMPKGSITNKGVATKSGWLLKLLKFCDVEKFSNDIGFADDVKQSKMIDALDLIRTYGSKDAGRRWTGSYKKYKGTWVRIQ